MRTARSLSGIVALLLALQWGTAFARCFALHAAGSIEVCTNAGVVHMPWPGETGGTAKPVAFACPACAALPALDAPPAPVVSAPISFARVAFAVPVPRGAPAPPRDHVRQPRAPPAA